MKELEIHLSLHKLNYFKMKNLHLYFILITSILGSNIIYSQVNENITYQDYNNFVLSVDKYKIGEFASERNFMVVKIYHEGNRQYLVTYRNIYNGKIINGIYNGNLYTILSSII